MLAHTDGRRVRKSTRACDRCRSKKLRCSGTRPCTTCASRGQSCAFEALYLRGRPPTPPNAAIDGTSPTTACMDSARLFGHQPEAGSRLASPALVDAADVDGHYVGPTSGLSFLHRAQQRFAHAAPEAVTEPQADGSARWTSSGDKPFVAAPNSFHVPSSQDAVDLLDLYFDVCVATYRILHRPTVDVWQNILQQNVARARSLITDIGQARLAIVLGVFAIATFHRQRQRGAWHLCASFA